MKKLHDALPKLGLVNVDVIVKKSLNNHLSKVNKLIEWVQKEIANDPLDALIKIEQTFAVMMAAHSPEERHTQWFKDKMGSLNRKRAALESKKSKYDPLDAMDVENTLKSYRDSIHRELSMLEYRSRSRYGDEDDKKTLKVMEVIDGIKYERNN